METFTSNHIVSTPGALEALNEAKLPARDLLDRHFACDWSGCEPEDAESNRRALTDGSRIMSVYTLPNTGREVWIITEGVGDDGTREATTVLLPEEY